MVIGFSSSPITAPSRSARSASSPCRSSARRSPAAPRSMGRSSTSPTRREGRQVPREHRDRAAVRFPHRALHPDAARRRPHRSAVPASSRGRPLHRTADRAAADLRRSGRDRHRERAAVQGAGRPQHELRDALEQQTATSEILRVISSSPTDVQPVFDAIAAKALRSLPRPRRAWVYRFDGELIHIAAAHSLRPEAVDVVRESYPMPPSQGGATARAVLSRAIVYISNIREDADYRLEALAQGGRLLERPGRADGARRRDDRRDHGHGGPRRERSRRSRSSSCRPSPTRPSSPSRMSACSPSWRLATASCAWRSSSRRPPPTSSG